MQLNIDRQTTNLDSTTKMQMTRPEEDQCNESIIILLSIQHDLQKQSLDMMQNMTSYNEYDNL